LVQSESASGNLPAVMMPNSGSNYDCEDEKGNTPENESDCHLAHSDSNSISHQHWSNYKHG